MVAAGALSVPTTGLHMSVKSFHIASSCLSLLALGRGGAKNNQAGTSIVGHSL
jgi:hypothetical protein